MVYAVSFDNCAVVVEVNAETDFVAKNDKFVEFTKELAKVVADQNPADVEALMGCKMGDGTVDDALKALILVIKENIKVRRFARYEGHCAEMPKMASTIKNSSFCFWGSSAKIFFQTLRDSWLVCMVGRTLSANTSPRYCLHSIILSTARKPV